VKRYLLSMVLALNQTFNALTGGSPMDTLSYRLAVHRAQGSRAASFGCRVFETFDFHPSSRVDHCEKAIEDHWIYVERVNQGQHPRGH
jgi:hypothetical protein